LGSGSNDVPNAAKDEELIWHLWRQAQHSDS
jgi:hypothetical protein